MGMTYRYHPVEGMYPRWLAFMISAGPRLEAWTVHPFLRKAFQVCMQALSCKCVPRPDQGSDPGLRGATLAMVHPGTMCAPIL